MTTAANMTTTQGLALSRIRETLIVRFDRPKSANAMTIDMMEALAASIGRLCGDPDIKSIILTGAPARQFSAGADIRNTVDPKSAVVRTRGRAAIRDLLLAIVDCTKPVIAAVNGAAIGAGAMVALVSDCVVAAETASLGFPEIDIGSPSPLAIALLTQLINASTAHDLVLTGRRVAVQQALASGLVGALWPEAELQERALECADALARKPASAFIANKRYSRRLVREQIVSSCAWAQRLQDETEIS